MSFKERMAQYHSQARRLKVIAHPTRLRLLNALSRGEECVCHLTALLGRRQAYVSQQLMFLRQAGLLADRKEGSRVYYRIKDQSLFRLLAAMNVSPDGMAKPPRRQTIPHCPCPPLLHNHTSYLRNRKRLSQRHLIGNIAERALLDLWNDSDYAAYRERVQGFAFPPCSFCGGCEMLEANQEDCLGNGFPACGGCLWAQGVIQCP
jgi:DNA-binding transcriptional ArsR family regulator